MSFSVWTVRVVRFWVFWVVRWFIFVFCRVRGGVYGFGLDVILMASGVVLGPFSVAFFVVWGLGFRAF